MASALSKADKAKLDALKIKENNLAKKIKRHAANAEVVERAQEHLKGVKKSIAAIEKGGK